MYVMKFEMAHDNSSGAAAGGARREVSPPAPPGSPPPPDRAFHHRILQLKKQQQLQQQILLEHYQQQQQQLTEQYEAQIQQQWKLWEQQKALEEQAAREARERRERERLELLRKKDKHDHSAIASTEVKQKLQVFLMKKQAAASANGTVPGSPYRNWGVVKSSSGESITSSVSNSHPYRMPQQPVLTKYDSNDFPLRKTASEPNMLKVRLKARVIERRASPMARRPQAKLRGGKVTHHRANDTSGSPRGSPTGGAAAPIREEEEGGFAAPAPAPAAIDLQLFSSPSMPNISLGRPHITSGAPSVSSLFTYVSCVQEGGMLAPVSEARGAEVAPYYAAPAPVPAAYITGAQLLVHQVAQARLHKRPLGRTQSAPLPLGEPQYALRQQIRQTVLTRAARLPEEPDLIDLTDKRPRGANSSLPPTAACGDTGEQRPTPDDARPANPLSRTLSSPLVGAPAGDTPCTGLAYDALMLKHACACGARAPQHPEHGGRLQSVWARLHETGLAARCRRTRPAKATLEELQTCHSEAHTLLFGTNPLNRAKHASRLAALPMKSLVKLACGGLGVDSDTTWSELHTAPAARMAAGCVIDLAFKCYAGELKNGFAVVRPPGHHAERTQAMGFCFFNSVAVAAKLLQQRMNLQRILIVDWDVHHGNGTQQIFYDDPQVLYISIHRHDDGNFFPGTGGPTECGSGAGLGYNVNIAWSGGLTPPLGDAEYLAAFRTIVMPIAKEYKPQMVLVSCGFDAAAGHPAPLGGYNVSPACFGHMTKELMQLADGKVVLALEGGYDLPGMCDCAQECVRALLGDETAPLPAAELTRVVAPHALDTLHKTVAVQLSHWSCVKRYSVCAGVSAMNAARLLQSERDAADTTLAMASLSMRHLHQQSVSPDESREVSEEPMEQDEGK